MANKIRGLNPDWNNFILCIMLHFFIPFLPIFLEYLFTKTVSEQNLIIFISIYSLSMGLSSRNVIIGILCFIVSIFFSAFYGFTSGDNQQNFISIWAGLGILALIIIPHLIERYNRHYIEQEIFFKWQLSKTKLRG